MSVRLTGIDGKIRILILEGEFVLKTQLLLKFQKVKKIVIFLTLSLTINFSVVLISIVGCDSTEDFKKYN